MNRIPCPHETREVADWTQDAPDHHPLSDREIEELADTALTLRASGKHVAEIQVRLAQAIPGMTCPRACAGPVSDRLEAMEREFVGGLIAGRRDEWIRRLQEIINGGRPVDGDVPRGRRGP